eukprot:132829-Prorocentrum_minimum.AAC.1
MKLHQRGAGPSEGTKKQPIRFVSSAITCVSSSTVSTRLPLTGPPVPITTRVQGTRYGLRKGEGSLRCRVHPCRYWYRRTRFVINRVMRARCVSSARIDECNQWCALAQHDKRLLGNEETKGKTHVARLKDTTGLHQEARASLLITAYQLFITLFITAYQLFVTVYQLFITAYRLFVT